MIRAELKKKKATRKGLKSHLEPHCSICRAHSDVSMIKFILIEYYRIVKDIDDV